MKRERTAGRSLRKTYSSEEDNSDDSILGTKIVAKKPHQIVNEFKAFTLPKLRIKNLIKLQAVFRGVHTRMFKIPRLKAMHEIAEDYVVRKVNEWLEDKIIPDLVMEVITHNKYNEDFSLYSPNYQTYYEIIEKITNNVVTQLSNEVVT